MPQTLDNLTYTWNNAGTTFTGIRYDVQDTASAAGSLLMDLRTSNVSRFSVAKNGAASVHSVAVSNINGIDGPAEWRLRVSGNIAATLFSNTMSLPSAGTLAWNGGSPDLALARDEANILAQRRGTNAQTFRIYNTFTDVNTYERGYLRWSSNVFQIGTEKLAGTARALEFQTDGATRVSIATNAAVLTGDQNGWNSAGNIGITNAVYLRGTAQGVLRLTNFPSANDFDRLQFGGATSSFPALKRSTTSLQVRLADDSAFTNIQGKLTTETAYTAGAPTATGYIVLYDSTGTAYKVPAEAL